MSTQELVSFGCGAIFLFQGTALVLGASATGGWRRTPEVIVVGLGQLSVGAAQWSMLEATNGWAPWSEQIGSHLAAVNIYAMPVPMLLFNHLFMGRGYRGSFAWGWKSLLVWCIAASAYEIAIGAPGAVAVVNSLISLGTLTVITVNIATGHMKTRDTGSVLQNATAVMVVATLHDVLIANGTIADSGMRLMQFGLLAVLLAMVYGLLVRAKTNNDALASMEGELRAAEAIQRSLLPRAPSNVPAKATATRCIPTEAVGGDIYDFHEAGDDRIGMLIADVTGHGVPAAMLASMVKAAASGEAAHAADPGRVLAGMNRRLQRDAAGNLVSAIYAYADLKEGSPQDRVRRAPASAAAAAGRQHRVGAGNRSPAGTARRRSVQNRRDRARARRTGDRLHGRVDGSGRPRRHALRERATRSGSPEGAANRGGRDHRRNHRSGVRLDRRPQARRRPDDRYHRPAGK